MIYTIEQIKELVKPIAQKYRLKTLWVFGSYARGEATNESDIDFLIDDPDFNLPSLYDLVDLCDDLKFELSKEIDLISTDALFSLRMRELDPKFIDLVSKERIVLYERP
jgi:predicted nucleotidyltransferase